MAFDIKISKALIGLGTARVQGAISDREIGRIGLEALAGKLTIYASDNIISVYSTHECEVKAESRIFIPAKLFTDVVRELPDGLVRLWTKDSFLVISAGKANEFEMKFPLIDNIQWQPFTDYETSNTAELPAAKLLYVIEQVQFCVAPDSPRNYGTVALLHRPNPDTIRLVGTDGYRLSYCEVRIPMPDGFLDNGICLSKRSLGELLRMTSEGFEKIRFSINKEQTTLIAEVEDYKIVTALSRVQYPNYSRVIPETRQSMVLISRPQIQNVTKRVLLAADKTRALQLSFADSALTVSGKSSTTAEGKEVLELGDYHGPKIDLAVNGRFLNDLFSAIPSDKILIHFKDVKIPLMVVPRDEPADCQSRHVLVPIIEGHH